MKVLKPSLQFIIAGDIRQIPPPCDRVDFEYRDALVFHELCMSNRVELTKCRRSDKKLFDLSLKVDKINISEFPKIIRPICMSYTNETRKEINAEWMDRFSVKANKFQIVPALSWDNNSQEMKVYPGLPVIARKNALNLDIANNETFTVKSANDTEVVLLNDDKKTIKIATMQMSTLFYPAYCMTVHRLQGSTIDQPGTIFEWNKMDTKLRYTAFTRFTKLEYINFCD